MSTIICYENNISNVDTLGILEEEFSDIFDIKNIKNRSGTYTLDYIIAHIIAGASRRRDDWSEKLYGTNDKDIIFKKTDEERNYILIEYLRKNKEYIRFLML